LSEEGVATFDWKETLKEYLEGEVFLKDELIKFIDKALNKEFEGVERADILALYLRGFVNVKRYLIHGINMLLNNLELESSREKDEPELLSFVFPHRVPDSCDLRLLPLSLSVAVADHSDLCWISSSFTVNKGGVPEETRAFRCLKFLASTYLLVNGVPGIAFKKGSDCILLLEFIALRMPQPFMFNASLASAVSARMTEDLKEILEIVDAVIVRKADEGLPPEYIK